MNLSNDPPPPPSSPPAAKVYETSTETLFVGRQDAMQRSTLVPLADFMHGRDASQLRALEVAAGTGRFATFVKAGGPPRGAAPSRAGPGVPCPCFLHCTGTMRAPTSCALPARANSTLNPDAALFPVLPFFHACRTTTPPSS